MNKELELNFLSKIENLYQQFKQHDAEKTDRLERCLCKRVCKEEPTVFTGCIQIPL